MALLTAAPIEAPVSVRSTRLDIKRVLLDWRKQPSFGRVEGVILALYCALISAIIPFHEPWGDEAQAWLIAQYSSGWEMIRHRLHYEGAPPLWYLLLHTFQLAGGTYAAIDWFSAAFAAGGVFVMLRWSPFPLLIRALLPFTFVFAYQYAVIARGYVLFPLLVFLLCALYGRQRQIVWFGVSAGMLANLSMQGFVLAGLLGVLYISDVGQYRGWKYLLGWRGLRGGVAAFALLGSVATYAASPAPDGNFMAGGAANRSGTFHKLLVRYIGEAPRRYATPAPLDVWRVPEPERTKPSFSASPRDWAAWMIDHRDVLDRERHPRPPLWWQARMEDLLSILSQACWPVANSNLLACVFLALVALWLHTLRGLRMLVPWFLLMVMGQVLWVADHHGWMLMVALLGALWIGYQRSTTAAVPAMEFAMSSVFAVVLLLQIAWTVYCVRFDVRQAYDPGRDTAAFMKANPVSRTAGFHFWGVSVQPFFAEQPFYNQATRYWLWSWNTDSDPYYRTVVAEHPERIVYSVEFPGSGQLRNQWVPLTRPLSESEIRTLPWDLLLAYFHAHGYEERHRFCGTRVARFSSSYIQCNLILEPAGPDPLAEEAADYLFP